jgi:endonuclease/exonuclease/phosphatase family metal-dependent hydrolase
MLVRSWNVYHGNAYPPERRDHLEEMIRLVTADRPDVVCLQELPVWSLSRLELWSGMTAVTDITERPLLPRRLAKTVTGLHHGLFRSAFTGQANALLLAKALPVLERRSVVLEKKEHRRCQAVKVDRDVVIGNLHATGDRRGSGDSELVRAVSLLDSLGGSVTILGGDFNMRPALAGFSPPGPGIDHILVRGAPATPVETWPVDRRTVESRVLSDHAPVEVRVDL